MLGHKRFLDTLLDSRNGLSVHSIHFVEVDLLYKKTEEQLRGVGLGGFEPIHFSVQGESYCKNGALNTDSDRRGCTINMNMVGCLEQVILIQKSFPKAEDLSSECQEDWKFMLQLITLAHELGHVEDMQLKKNSNFSYDATPIVNLVEAEAYAHTYCLNYLHQVGAHTARRTLARALYKMNSTTQRFEKSLYRSICNRIGKSRIKKWANA